MYQHITPEREFRDLLKQAGAVLLRQKKHRIYKLANGRTFVTSNTASDRRALKNQIADLRKLM